MRFASLPLADINPFDATHIEQSGPPGFHAVGDHELKHLKGALWVASMIERGARLRPIVVCPADLVPDALRDGARPWHRLDGFKRYWGHRLLGLSHINCLISDEYSLGPQHGLPTELSEEEWVRLSAS